MRITLNGQVVASEDQWLYDWFGVEAFSPATVRQALADNPEGEDLEVEINSPGGSVFAGFELYSLLREARCKTVAIVQSLAGSAASTVMAACDLVQMSPVAQVMIHLPSSWAAGNQNDMKHEAKVLESITQSILNGYEAKCRGKADRARLDKLIRAESWLTRPGGGGAGAGRRDPGLGGRPGGGGGVCQRHRREHPDAGQQRGPGRVLGRAAGPV